MSIEALAEPSQNFLARTTMGQRVIELKGKLRPMTSGQYRLDISFQDRDGGNQMSVSTNMVAAAGDKKAIGGFMGGTEHRTVLVLTLTEQPEEQTASLPSENAD